MSGISQTIPHYHGGISEQPDYLKPLGCVKDAVNVVPDITYGLYKRLGAKRVATDPLTISNENCKWFHYYRNKEEGSYLGQIDKDGVVKMWRCSDGQPSTIAWQATDQFGGSIGETSIKNYLKDQSGSPAQENYVKTITLNDTTFVSQQGVACDLEAGTSTDKLHSHYAYLELRKTENGRQYGFDITNSGASEQSYWQATRLRVARVGPSSADPGSTGQGHCPHIGTRIHTAPTTHDDNGTAQTINANITGRNLVYRLTVTGQQMVSDQNTTVDHPDDYSCTYTMKIDLLHGGHGWVSNEKKGSTGLNVYYLGDDYSSGWTLMGAQYKIIIDDAEEYKAKVISTGSEGTGALKAGFIRPDPTPFDSDTATSASAILGGMKRTIDAQVGGSGISAEIIGNGIYLSSSSAFTVKVIENDLMRVVTDNTNDVSNLPNQCKNGYLVKITNSQDTRADDYWLKFEAYNGLDGPGQWIETMYPNIRYRPDGAKLPHTIKRTGTNTFTVGEFDWTDRTVGDNFTNPRPYFITQPSNGQTTRYIHRVLYWRNRLVLANESMLDLSAPNDLGNFWRQTALTTGPNDAIHIKNGQNYPAAILQGVETTAGLVLFTENEQFLMYSADGTVTPESLVITPLSSYFSNKNLEPVSLGTTIGFIDNSGRNSRFMEMAAVRTDVEPTVFEHSKPVPTLMPNDIDIIDISRDNNMIFFGKTGTDTVYVYRWYQQADKRYLSSWVKWKFNKSLKYFFVTDDTFYFLDDDKFLQKINLISGSDDATVTDSGIDWNVHLDNWVEFTVTGGASSGGGYVPPSNDTHFTCSWLSSVTGVTAKLVIVDPVNGNYDECEIDGTTVKAPGNWSKQVDSVTITNGGSGYTSAPTVTFSGGSDSSTFQAQATATVTNGVVTAVNITDPGYNYTGTPTIAFSGGGGSNAAATAVVADKRYIGYLYDMEVEFPKLYPTKTVGQSTVADVNASLVLHRLNIAFGRVGGYEFELNRTGKDTYNETYSSTPADSYESGDVPYLLEEVKTIPVYDKNTNVTFKLKSTNPSPATLRSLSWEGDYTTKSYRRV
tara:strand:- start:4112 stop:7288 length:3177 start_codon:yes stop_codon:yes gene_type:complete